MICCRNVVKVQLPYVPVARPPPADPELLKARRQELGNRGHLNVIGPIVGVISSSLVLLFMWLAPEL